jgi:hypothetical protein
MECDRRVPHPSEMNSLPRNDRRMHRAEAEATPPARSRDGQCQASCARPSIEGVAEGSLALPSRNGLGHLDPILAPTPRLGAL